MTIRLLVSVRTVHEALLAAGGGADFIDLKEPGQGALGGLPVVVIGQIVGALRAQHPGLPISATIGDVPMLDLAEIQSRVLAVAACGVDFVKVGIQRGPGATALLAWLAACGHGVVPVFIADSGIDGARWRQALALPLAGVMIDTADKLAGSLFDVLAMPELAALLAQARAARRMVGLAGALRLPHLQSLRALAPDFAGFRSAVCEGDRSGELSPVRLTALVQALRGVPGQALAAAAHRTPVPATPDAAGR